MPREPLLMAVCGKKRVGKSYRTIEYIRNYVFKSPRRKALIFDVNNEYSDKSKFPDIVTIAIKDVPLYAKQRLPQIRRIAPFFDDGEKMTLDDMSRILQWLVRNFYNGLLLAEDINKYVSDHMPGDLIGAICTNAHAGLDVILHYQSVGRLTTKIWQNINILRMHKNTDSVDRHRNKFEDKYEYLKIAEMLVNAQYKAGNERYYLFVDFDNEKVHCGLDEKTIRAVIVDYVSANYNHAVSKYLFRRNDQGGKLYDDATAFNAAINDIYDVYFAA